MESQMRTQAQGYTVVHTKGIERPKSEVGSKPEVLAKEKGKIILFID